MRNLRAIFFLQKNGIKRAQHFATCAARSKMQEAGDRLEARLFLFFCSFTRTPPRSTEYGGLIYRARHLFSTVLFGILIRPTCPLVKVTGPPVPVLAMALTARGISE
jgi:hypothetical protein